MSTSVPQNDLQAGYQAQKQLIDAAIARVLDSGSYILGKEVKAFEQAFADYIGVEAGIGVASGTDAVEIALRACEIGTGDLVFSVSHTAVGTITGIERSGANATLVDVDQDTYTMCPQRLEDRIRSSIKTADGRPAAIVAVHLYGQMSDMPAILDVAQRFDLRVVEDCAQAHGALIDGRPAGSWGDAAAFSFYPTKNLGAMGDGGMVVTTDSTVAKRAQEIRQYGWQQWHVSNRSGFNSRLDELQAAILNVRLSSLDENNDRRRRVADRYDHALSENGAAIPLTRQGATHVYHQYVMMDDRRDVMRRFLQDRGITTSIHYPQPVHQQPAYSKRLIGFTELQVTEQIAERAVSLPMYPQLTSDQVESVTEAIRIWLRQKTLNE